MATVDRNGHTLEEILRLIPEDTLRGSSYVACRSVDCPAWVMSDGVWVKHYHAPKGVI